MTLNHEQIQQALGDILQVFCQLPLEAQEWLSQRTYEVMKQRNNSSFYTLASFRTIHALAKAQGLAEGASVLEIGAGKPLGMGILWNFAGARRYTAIDKFVPVNLDELWLTRFRTLLELSWDRPAPLPLSDLVTGNGDGHRLNRDRIDLIQGDFARHPFAEASFDLIYSFAVLEHVTELPALLAKMRRLLRPGGTMIHLVDLREHHTHLRQVPDKDRSVAFLAPSRAEWEALYPPGSEHYINRLRASDYERAAREAGLEIVEMATTQVMDAPASHFAGIHAEFRRYDVEDLRKLGIRLVLKKKAGPRPGFGAADPEKGAAEPAAPAADEGTLVQTQLDRAAAQWRHFESLLAAGGLSSCLQGPILELGCGHGGFVHQGRQKGYDVWGIDVDPEPRRTLVAAMRRLGLPQALDDRCLTYDGQLMPFPANRFGLVYSWYVLEHIRDLGEVLRETVRVTRPGGILYLIAQDHRNGYEGHAQIPWLPYLPKPLIPVWLAAFDRQQGYDHLATSVYAVTAPQVADILRTLGCEILSEGIQPRPPIEGHWNLSTPEEVRSVAQKVQELMQNGQWQTLPESCVLLARKSR